MSELSSGEERVAPPPVSQGRRMLLYASFVVWIVMVVLRFAQTGEARQERRPGANPVLAGLAGKILDACAYVQSDPQFKQQSGLGTRVTDSVQPKAADLLDQALKEAPDDIPAQAKFIILAAVQKQPKLVQERLADVVAASQDQPDQKPFVAVLQKLYGRDSARLDEADRQLLRDTLRGWFQDEALIASMAPTQRSEADTLRQDEVHRGYTAGVAFLVVGSVICVNFLMGCLLLMLLPFFHKVASLREADETAGWWWGDGWMVYIWFMLVEVGVGLTYLVVLKLMHQAGTPGIWSIVGVQAVIYAASLAGVVWLVYENQNARWLQLGVHARHLLRCMALGVASYMCALPCIVVAALCLEWLFKYVKTSQNGVFSLFAHPPAGLELYALLGLVCVVGPLFEEIMFRGVLYSSLRVVLKPWQAMLVSAAIFSLIHADIPALLPIFILAMFMAFVYEKTGSLVPSFVMHVLQNSMTFCFVLFLVS